MRHISQLLVVAAASVLLSGCGVDRRSLSSREQTGQLGDADPQSVQALAEPRLVPGDDSPDGGPGQTDELALPESEADGGAWYPEDSAGAEASVDAGAYVDEGARLAQDSAVDAGSEGEPQIPDAGSQLDSAVEAEADAEYISEAGDAADADDVLDVDSGTEDGSVADSSAADSAGDAGSDGSATPQTKWVSVGAGTDVSCGVRQDGTLACWGSEHMGMLDPPDGVFTSVVVGDHACALDGDGHATCWGLEAFLPDPPPSGSFLAIDTGSMRTCGIRKSMRAVRCWGDDSYGQPMELDSNNPVFLSVGVGSSSTTCVVRDDKLGVKCYGKSVGLSESPAGCLGHFYTQVSVGGSIACARSGDGLCCWGESTYINGTPTLENFAYVSVGHKFACGLRTDGSVICWGDGSHGQTHPPGGAFAQISAGDFNVCGVKTDGTLACWGRNDRGQSSPPVY